jgi:hypothetical protein
MPRSATTDFEPLDLSADDLLPADIELVMGYRGELAAEDFATALERGLRAFPHLTGKLDGMRIVPTESAFALETVDITGAMGIRDLEEMPLASQSSTFIPGGRADSLFAARWTRFTDTDLCMLGIRVSHAAVDGTGLALFINECTAARRGVGTPTLFHERRHAFGTMLDGDEMAPHGYREAQGASQEDLLAGCSPTLFAIPSDNVRKHFQATTLLDARLRLAAWLCAALESHFPEVALWCDPRGLNGIPATYTGNLGCYLHFENRADDLTKQLKATATRAGFQRIAETLRRIKLAESRGRPLAWQSGALQINLVPHAVAGTDFGIGLPGYAILLSRNSSGLRISLTPETSRFLIEACLPDGLGEILLDKCYAAGLMPSPWCRGGKP